MSGGSGQIRALLTKADQLSTQDLSLFLSKLRELLYVRNEHAVVPEAEAKLLAQFQDLVPAELLQRAAQLHQQRMDQSLSFMENEELVQLNERIEQLHLERLELLSQLSIAKEIPLKTLMDELGIRPFSV